MTMHSVRVGRAQTPPREPPVVAGRVPPHDLDAEAAVLSACLLDHDALDRVLEILQPEHFYSDANRLVYESCRALSLDGTPVDVVSVASWLRSREQIQRVGGAAYLGQLVDATPAVAHVGAHARVVKEKWRLRRLIAVCQKFAAEGYGDVGGTTQEFIDAAEQSVYEIARTPETSSVYTLKDVLTTTFQQISAAAERGDQITGIPTGFVDLDRMTAGLHKGDLMIVAARPGMGKTSFVLNLAVHVASPKLVQVPGPGEDGYGAEPAEKRGWGVAVFSLEMPKEQVAARLVCSEARVDLGKLRQGRLSSQDWADLTSAASVLANVPVWIDDSPGLSILELRAKVRRLKADYARQIADDPSAPGLGLVVIDYLQLMQGRAGVASREQEISEISRGLKHLAKELEVPVIALSQLNRGVETRAGKDKRPLLADLRECVTGETLVMLADGRRVPIRELNGTMPQVLAVSDGRVTTAPADKVWKVGVRRVREIALASGRSIRVTDEHRLRGASGWVHARDLAPGDRLALARRVLEPSSPREWPEARVVLMAHLLGDGSYLPHQPLRYTTASDENSDAVARAARDEFDARVTRHPGRGEWHQLVIAGNGNRWHPRGVGLWLRQLGVFGQRSHEKRVPEEVFQLSNAQVALFLRHLWATDGSIFVRSKGRGSHRVFLATCSRALAGDVAALLLRFGIVARIRATVQEGGRPVYAVDVSSNEQQRRFLDAVGAFGPRVGPARALARTLANSPCATNVDTLPIELWGRVRARMQELQMTQRGMAELRATAYGGTSHYRFAPSRRVMAHYARLLEEPELMAAATDDLFWDRVVDTRIVGNVEVYDLTVPGPACWLADGIVSHNSGAIEQDADTIVFIYRDEYYNREQTQDRGIAELIIAKQRNGPTGIVKTRFQSSCTRFENLAPGEYDFDDGM